MSYGIFPKVNKNANLKSSFLSLIIDSVAVQFQPPDFQTNQVEPNYIKNIIEKILVVNKNVNLKGSKGNIF